MKVKFSSGNLKLGGNFAQTLKKILVYVWKIHTTDDAILHRLTRVILFPSLVEVILHNFRKFTSSININLRN